MNGLLEIIEERENDMRSLRVIIRDYKHEYLKEKGWKIIDSTETLFYSYVYEKDGETYFHEDHAMKSEAETS